MTDTAPDHIIMWRTEGIEEIARIVCARVSEKTVWRLTPLWERCKSVPPLLPAPVREAMETSYHSYHKTWEEAHAYLIKKARRRYELAVSSLDQAMELLNEIEAMKKPEGA
jgi:hypothetical protein